MSNILIRQKKHLLKYCYIIILLWKTKQVLKTFVEWNDSFITLFHDTFAGSHYSLAHKYDTRLSTSEGIWLWLNRQSFYHHQKWQLVPTDQYGFRSIRKLHGSVSVYWVAYQHLNAFPHSFHYLILLFFLFKFHSVMLNRLCYAACDAF